MRSSFFDPGLMSARVDVEVAAEEPDGQGGVSQTWAVKASCWALIEPVSHMIDDSGAALRPVLTHRVWLYWRSDIVAGMRLRKGERLFEVDATQDVDETRRYLICHCHEAAR